jgi:glucose dehydrogenase
MQEMSRMRVCVNRATVAGVIVTVAAGLAAGGCASSSAKPSAASCSGQHAVAGQASGAPGGSAGSAAGWTLPGGNLANTRDVASVITGSNVSTLGVAWCVPVQSTGVRGTAGLGDGYATTAVVVDGVVYLQDLESNVMAIRLATGRVLWTRDYNSLNGGPDGVNVVNGVVYAATNEAAVALSAATGKQLWSRVLIGNDLESIDMPPGYNDGAVYVSTVPVSAKGEYLGGARSTLWALN